MTKEELNNKLWKAAKLGDYIDFGDDAFLVREEGEPTRLFNHVDYLFDYLEANNKIIKSIRCIDGKVGTVEGNTTCNLFIIIVINNNYTLEELIELGYSFKEINKILKQQQEE